MGQASKRGTFAERKAAAIARRQTHAEPTPSTPTASTGLSFAQAVAQVRASGAVAFAIAPRGDGYAAVWMIEKGEGDALRLDDDSDDEAAYLVRYEGSFPADSSGDEGSYWPCEVPAEAQALHYRMTAPDAEIALGMELGYLVESLEAAETGHCSVVGYSIAGRPTQALYFGTSGGCLARVTPDGLVILSECEHLRSEDVAHLDDESRAAVLNAAAIARKALQRDLVGIDVETVYLD